MRRLSLSVPDRLANLVDAVVTKSGATEDVPVLKQAEVLRLLIERGASDLVDEQAEPVEVDGADLYDLVPESHRILWERERFKDGEAQLRNLRTGFEPRVKRHFKRRFKNGTRPEQIEEWAVNMRMDARILFPGEEHARRRNECLSYVDTFVDAFRHAYDTSSVDMLDPETALSVFGGVEDGARWQDVTPEQFLQMAQSARDRISRLQAADPESIGVNIASAYGVDDDVGRKAAQAGQEMLRRGIDDPDVHDVTQLVADGSGDADDRRGLE